MSKMIHCHTHGECEPAYVCTHLTEDAAGHGFNRAEPSEADPYPNAWCDNCWTDETRDSVELRMLCSGCYELSRIRNTRTDVSFEELSQLRWKCSSCEEWHYGPCLDFSYDAPVYWTSENEGTEVPTNMLNEDFCIVDGEHYFIRGVIHLPIIGTTETFCWGVWGSLSRENFEKVVAMNDDPDRVDLPPMFSWLSNEIDEYPDTLNLKMYAHIQQLEKRPVFELEPTDHPLSQEFYDGITPERVKEIMMRRLDLPVN